MSRDSRQRVLRGSGVIVLALAALFAPPAQAGNPIDIGSETITITIPIDMVGGSRELANRWGPAITEYWNPGGQGSKWCGKEVIITTEIRVIPSLDQHIGGRHVVFVVNPPRRGQFMRPSVIGLDDPRQQIGTAYWPEQGRMSDQGYDDLIGFNAGEFLGVGILFEGESPIDYIVDAHGLDDELQCQLTARHEVEWWINKVVGGVRHDILLSVELDMVLEAGSGNQLRGQAKGSASVKGTSSETRFTCIADNKGEKKYSFEVTGTRDGDEVEVLLPGGLSMPWTVTPRVCGTATQPHTTPKVAIPYLRRLSGVLENGVFKRVFDPQSHPVGTVTGTVVYTVEIKEGARLR